MEEAPSAVGSIQGRQVFGKEAQVIWEGEESQERPPPDLDIPACRASVFLLRPLRPCARQHCPRRPFPGPAGCSVGFLCLVFKGSTEAQEAFSLSGGLASPFQPDKRQPEIIRPLSRRRPNGRGRPLPLRTPGAGLWLSGILVLLTRKHLCLPENPLRSVGKILDMIHVAGTSESGHFLCFSIYLSTHPLSIFHLLPLFFLSSFLPSTHLSIHSSIHPVIHPSNHHPLSTHSPIHPSPIHPSTQPSIYDACP